MLIGIRDQRVEILLGKTKVSLSLWTTLKLGLVKLAYFGLKIFLDIILFQKIWNISNYKHSRYSRKYSISTISETNRQCEISHLLIKAF